MIWSLLGIVAGLAVLTFASDQFVVGAARVAARLRLSTVVIGAVVVGFGTSAPEMLVSGLASSQGELDIALGNIIGSNTANLTLVLGASALVVPIVVGSPTIRRELPISVAATLLFAVFVQDGLTTLEAWVLLGSLAIALTWIIVASRGADEELSAEVEDLLTGATSGLGVEAGRTLLGLALTLGAAQLLVVSAVDLAGRFGLDEGFVGLTLVAIGTSLPELATSLQAARRRDTDLIVGNLLGSNLFNSLAVAGIAALAASPGQTPSAILTGLALVVMLTATAIAAFSMSSGRRVVRWEGALLLILWTVSLPLLA